MRPEQLIAVAAPLAVPFRASPQVESGGVAAALLSTSGRVFTGVCLDTGSSMGFCAEHAAVAEMLKVRESHLVMAVAVLWDGSVLPPCGRCRELMWQLDPRNRDARILLPHGREATLAALLPHADRWRHPAL